MFQKPFQLRPENDLQKAMRGAPTAGLSSGDREMTPVVMLTEGWGATVEKSAAERVVYVDMGALRQSMQEMLERGDVTITGSDLALLDTKRVRRAVLEKCYPAFDFRTDEDMRKAAGADASLGGERNQDGTFVKSRSTDVVKTAYKEYMKEPGADLKAAAAELDRIIAKQDGRN